MTSLLANIASALVAVPFLFWGSGGGSMWFSLINSAELLITEGEDYIFFSLLFFVLAFVFSVLIEILIGLILEVPTERLLVGFTLANFLTYSSIVLTLIGLGVWFGLTNQDPTVDSWDFFDGKLF
ncbi:MAG: hypothetical protein ACFFDT_17355, partial [Candidatus Hodarchaeota archaeon]